MSKYQEALDLKFEKTYIIDLHLEKFPEAQEALYENKEFKEYINKTEEFSNKYNQATADALQELIDKNKDYTLEEVKKEWEALGYELIRRERRFISYQNKLGEFIVMTWYSEFKYEKHWNGRSQSINLKEHNLIYKTMKLFEIELGG